MGKQKQEGKLVLKGDVRVEYEANTRGFEEKAMIQNPTIAVLKDRNGRDKPSPIKISDADWNQLMGFYKRVNLKKLASLKAPTEKRFYDGAAIAGLKIINKVNTYETTNFDHGFPPAEIKKLVDKIV